MEFFAFIHSLLRYAVLGTVAVAGFAALRGYLTKSPILSWERAAAIIGMILCHVQLVIGLLLYVTRYGSLQPDGRRGRTVLENGTHRYDDCRSCVDNDRSCSK